MTRLLTIEDLSPSIFQREGLMVAPMTLTGDGCRYVNNDIEKGLYFLKRYEEAFPDPLHYDAPINKLRERVSDYIKKHGLLLIDFLPEDIERLQNEDISVIILYNWDGTWASDQIVFKDTVDGIKHAAFAKKNDPGLKGARGKICLSKGKIIYTEEEGETK